MRNEIHRLSIRKQLMIAAVTLIIMTGGILKLLNVGLIFPWHADEWRSDQTNILQYLYPASVCVQIAEQQDIEIDVSLKKDLKKYTQKLFNKLETDRLYSTQIGQLIWLNDYYQFDYSKQLLSELQNFYAAEQGLYSFARKEQRTESMEKGIVLNTCEIYTYIKNNSENLKNFNVSKGLSRFLEEFTDIEYYGWGTLWQVSAILKEIGREDCIPRDKVHAMVKEELKEDLFQNLMKGQYQTNLAMIGTAAELSAYKIYFENDTQYKTLSQEIYNQMTYEEDVAYNSQDALFPLYLASLQDVRDVKENAFISGHYSEWLTENYHVSMENTLIRALGK